MSVVIAALRIVRRQPPQQLPTRTALSSSHPPVTVLVLLLQAWAREAVLPAGTAARRVLVVDAVQEDTDVSRGRRVRLRWPGRPPPVSPRSLRAMRKPLLPPGPVLSKSWRCSCSSSSRDLVGSIARAFGEDTLRRLR